MYRQADESRIWTQHVKRFPAIENHYKENANMDALKQCLIMSCLLLSVYSMLY